MWDYTIIHGAVVTLLSMAVSTFLLGLVTLFVWFSIQHTGLITMANSDPWNFPFVFATPGLLYSYHKIMIGSPFAGSEQQTGRIMLNLAKQFAPPKNSKATQQLVSADLGSGDGSEFCATPPLAC